MPRTDACPWLLNIMPIMNRDDFQAQFFIAQTPPHIAMVTPLHIT